MKVSKITGYAWLKRVKILMVTSVIALSAITSSLVAFLPETKTFALAVDNVAPKITWQLQPKDFYGAGDTYAVRPITDEIGTTKSVYIDSVSPESLVWSLTNDDHKNFDTSTNSNPTLWNNLFDGTHKFIAVFTDKAGNLTTSESKSFVVDRDAPVVKVNLNRTSYIKSGDIIKAADNPEIEATDTNLSKIEVLKNSIVTNQWTTTVQSRRANIKFLGEGTYTIRAFDKAGNASSDFTVTIDNTSPVITSDITDYARGEITAHVSQTEANPNRMYVEYDQLVGNKWVKKQGSWFYGTNSANLAVNTTQWANGTYQLKVSSDDAAWNHGAYAKSFTVDNTKPQITVKGYPDTIGNNGVYSKASFKLHDPAGTVTKVTLNGVEKDLTPNQWSDLNNVKPGDFGAKEGDNTLVLYDRAGNATTLNFVLDTILPTVNITSPAKDGTVLSGNVDVTGTIGDNHPSVSFLTVYKGDGTSGEQVGPTQNINTAETSPSVSWDTTKVQNGKYTIYLEAKDQAENDTHTERTVYVCNADGNYGEIKSPFSQLEQLPNSSHFGLTDHSCEFGSNSQYQNQAYNDPNALWHGTPGTLWRLVYEDEGSLNTTTGETTGDKVAYVSKPFTASDSLDGLIPSAADLGVSSEPKNFHVHLVPDSGLFTTLKRGDDYPSDSAYTRAWVEITVAGSAVVPSAPGSQTGSDSDSSTSGLGAGSPTGSASSTSVPLTNAAASRAGVIAAATPAASQGAFTSAATNSTDGQVKGAEDSKNSSTKADKPEVLGASDSKQWSLVNAAISLFMVIAGIVTLVGAATKKENKHLIARVLGAVLAAAAVIVFFVVEHFPSTMVFVNGWTILFVILVIVQIIALVRTKKTKAEN